MVTLRCSPFMSKERFALQTICFLIWGSIVTGSITTREGICQPGYRINKQSCFECFPGSYASGQDVKCHLCPKDFYMPNFGADSCWPCPDGRKTLKLGSDGLDKCLDASGRGPYKGNTEFVVAAICVSTGIVALCGIFGVIYFFMRSMKETDSDMATVYQKQRQQEDKPLLVHDDPSNHIYESIPELHNEMEERIYENIEEENDYEIPIQSEAPEYVEIVPNLPPRTYLRKSKSAEELQQFRGTKSDAK